MKISLDTVGKTLPRQFSLQAVTNKLSQKELPNLRHIISVKLLPHLTGVF